MWEFSFESRGFEWIDADNSGQAIIAFIRHGEHKTDDLVVVINFEVNPHDNFRLGMPMAGYWKEVFNTDDPAFGGSGTSNGFHALATEEEPQHGRDNSLVITVPPLGGVIFKYVRALPAKKKAASKAAEKALLKAKGKATGKVAGKNSDKSAAGKALHNSAHTKTLSKKSEHNTVTKKVKKRK